MSSHPVHAEPPSSEFGCYDCDIIAGESYVMDDFMSAMSLVFLVTFAMVALVFLYARFVSHRRQKSDADTLDE